MVTVVLPGGRTLDGILLARRLLPGGDWEYDVVLPIPVRAIRPLPGEDYTEVPTHRPPEAEPEWTIAPIGRPGSQEEVHRADACFMPNKHSGRTVTREQARAAISSGMAVCTVCRADP